MKVGIKINHDNVNRVHDDISNGLQITQRYLSFSRNKVLNQSHQVISV